jgi:hypothetical protein
LVAFAGCATTVPVIGPGRLVYVASGIGPGSTLGITVVGTSRSVVAVIGSRSAVVSISGGWRSIATVIIFSTRPAVFLSHRGFVVPRTGHRDREQPALQFAAVCVSNHRICLAGRYFDERDAAIGDDLDALRFIGSKSLEEHFLG